MVELLILDRITGIVLVLLMRVVTFARMSINVCFNCKKENCSRLRKQLCNTCYIKKIKFGDPNHLLAEIPNQLTDRQNNLIIGSMLGDGHLRKRGEKQNTSLVIKRAL